MIRGLSTLLLTLPVALGASPFRIWGPKITVRQTVPVATSSACPRAEPQYVIIESSRSPLRDASWIRGSPLAQIVAVATCPTAVVSAQIFSGERMTLRAGSFLGVERGETDSTAQIFSHCHNLEMGGIATRAISAEMVDHHAASDRANEKTIGEAVREESGITVPRPSVPVARAVAVVLPADARLLLREPLLEGAWRVSLFHRVGG